MQLVSNALAQECAMGALMVGYFMYYYEAWILPALMRQEKMQYKWVTLRMAIRAGVWAAGWRSGIGVWACNNVLSRRWRHTAAF